MDADRLQPGIQPLSQGLYDLVISDRIEDLFNNKLDGDFNGTAGGQFTRGFFVGDPDQCIACLCRAPNRHPEKTRWSTAWQRGDKIARPLHLMPMAIL